MNTVTGLNVHQGRLLSLIFSYGTVSPLMERCQGKNVSLEVSWLKGAKVDRFSFALFLHHSAKLDTSPLH